ncbi:MAG: hypothetical protein WCD34_06885 [Candidatus Acidiferrum sp.]
MPREYGRSAAANFEQLPWRHRSREAVMRRKLTQAIWSTTFDDQPAVGNPDAFPVEIYFAGSRVTRVFFWTSSGEERPVENCHFKLSRWIWDDNGEETGVFVIHVAKCNAPIWSKSGEPQTLPVEEVCRQSQGDAWSLGRKRCVSHDVALERFHESDTWIFAAPTAIGSPLIIGFRLKRDAEPLDACGIACFIELHSRNADARVISLRNHPWEEIERTIGASNGSRI